MKRPRILVIEDNQLVRWWISTILGKEGFVVVAPTTVQEGLRLCTALPFDVLVTDWRLPDGYDGFQVFATVRQAFPRIFAVLISADANAELKQHALETGFDRVFKKPIEPADLVGAIHACGADAQEDSGLALNF
jgi:CheY-like chemotaxis protein